MVIVASVAILVAAVGCRSERQPPSPPKRPPSPPVVVEAGDIVDCRREGDEATAKLAGGIDGSTILTLGDAAYPEGTSEEFQEC